MNHSPHTADFHYIIYNSPLNAKDENGNSMLDEQIENRKRVKPRIEFLKDDLRQIITGLKEEQLESLIELAKYIAVKDKRPDVINK